MLKLEHIFKIFNAGTVNEKKVLTDLSLTVNNGDFVTVIGSNGAGKSTLQNVISGTIFADSGHVILDNADITYKSEIERAKYIGRVFQDPMMGDRKSVV